MRLALLFLIPFLGGACAFIIRNNGLRRGMFLAACFMHLSLTASVWIVRPVGIFNGWLVLDAIGTLFLGVTSLLFFIAGLYALEYLKREDVHPQSDEEEGFMFMNAPEAVFTGCLLMFLASMTLVTMCQHFGLLWVGMELTTLVSAPLIYFHRHHRSLEATWKYLVICSVGIALALLGNIFLAIASLDAGGKAVPLLVRTLIDQAGIMSLPWLKVAFIFFLVGYGTKMGLAPLHTWLPDAHSESPSVVSALLSGALLNCAFLSILRIYQVCAAARLEPFCDGLFIIFGLLSMAFAALFILRQADYKRMLAYSSVEHMGILVFGIGIGGQAVFGSMFHVINHSLAKAMLFLLAGNVLAVFRTKLSGQVKGMIRVIPVTGALLFTGFFAVSGMPPFGVFVSKFIIVNGAFTRGRIWAGACFLAILAAIFIGMVTTILRMVQGEPEDKESGRSPEPFLRVFPPAVLCAMLFILGVYMPAFLYRVLNEAARALGGGF